MKSQYKQKNTNSDEQVVVAQAVSREDGWQDAFSILVAQHQGYLLQRCLRRLGNSADAEDVVQEVLLSAFRYLPKFEGRSSLRTWLTRIADNHCSAYLRKRQRYVQSEHVEALIELHEAVPDLQDEVLDRDQVEHLMQALPQGAQVVLKLRYWSDLSVEDISATLGLGRSAVKMRAHRALQQCRNLIDTDDCLVA